MKSKIFAIMLAVMMVVSILPTGVFAADPVAKIGDTEYFDISAAFTNATANCTITLLKDVTVTKDWNCQNEGAKFNVPVTIDGNGNTLKFTGKLTNGNWNNVFRFEKEATVKNLTIDVSEAKNAWRVITARVSFNMDNCVIIGDGNTRYGVIVGEGAGSDIDTVVANISNSEFKNLRKGVCDNDNGQDMKEFSVTDSVFENAKVQMSAYDSVEFTGNQTNDEIDIRSWTEAVDVSVTFENNDVDPSKKITILADTDGFVTFNANGGSITGISSKTVTFGQNYGSLPKATKRGATFITWAAWNGREYIPVQEGTDVFVHGDHTLVAIFDQNELGNTELLPRLFDVKLSAGEGGTVEGFSGKKTLMIAFGASRTIDFVADEYHVIKNVNVNGYDLGAIDSYKIVAAYGQYNIAVEFEDKMVTEKTAVYTEDFSGETKWVSGGTAEAAVVADGKLTVKSTGGDPNFNMPEAFGLACDDIDEIVVKYTNNTENTTFQIFFTNEANPGYSEAGSFKGTCAAGENEMVIKTEGNELWTGTLSNMRIDLSNGEGEFIVDEITFNTVETMTAKEAAELAAEAETVVSE